MSDENGRSEGITRRDFALGAGGAAAMLGLGSLTFIESKELCRPPGGQDEDRFVALCLHCERCREICPKTALSPAHLEDGLLNMRSPKMDFRQGWCDYCTENHDGVPQCVKVCPTEALKLPEGAMPETVIIGKAEIKKEWCLGWLLMGCQECVRACPYEALEVDEYKRPVVIEDKCNGCGACEYVCVSLEKGSYISGATDRAITVHPIERS
ncbi:MAG: 4Fe-4S dicluster domain-containing protein [Actinobacteria bacterium]|nr:4Fe-4S dicluster domain-containing protein [Actinomycetota bacterium]